MKLTKLFLAAAAVFFGAAAMNAGTHVVAHRGYWKAPGSAQNSIRALVKADSIGCYGSELDVWSTPDSVLIVNHDGVINGLNIQTTPAKVILQQKLQNGEYIPTLEEYFRAAIPLKTRLVVELKPFDNNALESWAVKEIVRLARVYGLTDRIDYITFSKNGFKNLVKAAPKGTSVQYLTGDWIPEQIKFMKGTGVDYHYNVFKANPDWVKRCHDKGLTVNVWTVDSPEEMQRCIDYQADFITTNEPETLQKMLKK